MIRSMTLLAIGLIAAPAAGQAQSAQFRCPEPGTTVERSAGGNLVYRGQDPNDPLVCIIGQNQRRFLGYWAAESAFYENGRAHLARLLSEPAGREVMINYFTFSPNTNTIIRIEEFWRVAGMEPVRVPAGAFNALRVERRFTVPFTTYVYTQTVWLDQASWAPVRARVEHLNYIMAPNLITWGATDLRLPALRPGS